MTDTKTIEGISAKNYDLYLIEANYTKEEMEKRIRIKQEQYKYAYEFRAKKNHLSKEETDEFLLKNMGENSKYVYMHQHIEKQNKIALYSAIRRKYMNTYRINKEDLENKEVLAEGYKIFRNDWSTKHGKYCYADENRKCSWHIS